MKFDKNFIIIFIVLLFISLYNNKLYTQPQDYEGGPHGPRGD